MTGIQASGACGAIGGCGGVVPQAPPLQDPPLAYPTPSPLQSPVQSPLQVPPSVLQSPNAMDAALRAVLDAVQQLRGLLPTTPSADHLPTAHRPVPIAPPLPPTAPPVPTNSDAEPVGRTDLGAFAKELRDNRPTAAVPRFIDAIAAEKAGPVKLQATLDSIKQTANAHISDARAFFAAAGVRSSEGNDGVNVVIAKPRDLLDPKLANNVGNASYSLSTDTISIGYTTNDGHASYAAAPDVLYHEYSHRIVRSLAPKLGVGDGARTVSESLADTFASLIDGNFRMGEGVGGPLVRDVVDGRDGAKVVPIHMRDYVKTDKDHGGAHANSAILTNAAYRIHQSLGTDATTRIYLDATRRLDAGTDIRSLPTHVMAATVARFGAGSREANAVRAGFAAVGLDVNSSTKAA